MKNKVLLVMLLSMATGCSWYQSNIAKYNPFNSVETESVSSVESEVEIESERAEGISSLEAKPVTHSKENIIDTDVSPVEDKKSEQQSSVATVNSKEESSPEKIINAESKEKKTSKKIINNPVVNAKKTNEAERVKKVVDDDKVLVSNKNSKQIVSTQVEKKSEPASINYPKFKTTTLNGLVSFSGDSEKTSVLGAIISLKDIDYKSVNAETKTYEVDMKGKAYSPAYLTIKTGDQLLFKNLDSIKHNVFSSSGENTFDLGTYGYNKAELQKFNHEGIVKVYCNIHPEMALFVSVTDNNLSVVTDGTGAYKFSNIKPGRYLLSVWHLRGTWSEEIVIEENKNKTQDITINIASYKPKPHLNKFGEPYKKTPPIFKDEFY